MTEPSKDIPPCPVCRAEAGQPHKMSCRPGERERAAKWQAAREAAKKPKSEASFVYTEQPSGAIRISGPFPSRSCALCDAGHKPIKR